MNYDAWDIGLRIVEIVGTLCVIPLIGTVRSSRKKIVDAVDDKLKLQSAELKLHISTNFVSKSDLSKLINRNNGGFAE